MSNTLERSGFTEGQPAAIIETVVLAMETFGVTPEILDERLDKVMDFIREQIAEVKAEGKEQVGDVKAQGKQQFEIIMAQIKTWGDNMKSLQQSVDGLKEGMLDPYERRGPGPSEWGMHRPCEFGGANLPPLDWRRSRAGLGLG